MRALPELVTLIKGMIKATRSVGSTLLLLIIVLYVFSIIFLAQLGDELPHLFGTIFLCMFTLFLSGTLLDNITAVSLEIIQKPDGTYHNLTMMFFLLLYILISSFTILNMLIGVLCEVVKIVAKEEGEKAMVIDMRHRLQEVHKTADVDGSGLVSFDEFERMTDYAEAVDGLEAIGVEPKHFGALASVLFDKEEKPGETKAVSFDEFVKSVVKLRPEKTASVMDVATLRYCLRSDIAHLRKEHVRKIEKIAKPQQDLEGSITRMSDTLTGLEAMMDECERLGY
jgi:hypothetical protein